MARSMVMAIPVYDSEPSTGKDAVFTGAFDIRNRTSIVLGVSFDNV